MLCLNSSSQPSYHLQNSYSRFLALPTGPLLSVSGLSHALEIIFFIIPLKFFKMDFPLHFPNHPVIL